MKLYKGCRLSMGFYKKILLLKETESGFSSSNKPINCICRIEIENGVAEIHLTIVNLLPKEETSYFFMLLDSENENFCFDLGKRPSSKRLSLFTLPNLEKGFAVGIFAVKNDIPLTVLFAREEKSKFNLLDFKKIVAEKCLENKKNQPKIKPIEEENPKPPIAEPQPKITEPSEFKNCESQVGTHYDDEAVATTNYYAFDNEINDKLSAFKEIDENFIRTANGQTDCLSQEETNSFTTKDYFFEDEKNVTDGEKYSRLNPFYKTVEAELTALFNKFNEKIGLEKIFPKSTWAKINYSKNRYYVVGLIKENGKEKYICYGVPATYSPNPPKELKGFCTFIPLSIFDLSGEGFWMMFQDAVSGECIKPKQTE